MSFQEIVQLAASSLALVAVVLYIIGGMIVNIHLSKYRIIEYQLVSIHYLVVAAIFLWNLVRIVAIAFIPAAFLGVAIILGVKWLIYASAIITFLATIAFGLWPRLPASIRKSSFILFILKVIAFTYPLSILVRIFHPTTPQVIDQLEQWIAYFVNGVLVVIFVIDYATEVYGTILDNEEDNIGGNIGRGIPQAVQIVCEKDDFNLLTKLGIPKVDPSLSEVIFLIGETDSHYIVTCDLSDEGEAIKIQKDIVRGLRYINKSRPKDQ